MTESGTCIKNQQEQTMTDAKQPVRLAGSVLSRPCHVCAFFHSKEEEYRVLMPFIKDGFERGDRAFHVVNPRHRPNHLRRLEREGIAVADVEARGQQEDRRWQDAYLKDDHFDQHRRLTMTRSSVPTNLSRFGAEVVILRTHPMVIIGGILQENPFYVPPDEMLEELKERRTRMDYAGAAC